MTEVYISRKGSITVSTPTTKEEAQGAPVALTFDDSSKKFDDPSPNKLALDVSQIDGIDDANLDRMVDSVLMSSRLNEKSLGVDNMNDINFSSSASKLLLEQKQDLRDLSVKFDDPSQAASSLYEETVTNMINGFKSNSKSKDRKPQSANTHYVSMLESENLELSEKALHLERELAEADNRYSRVSLENKRLIEELRNEISRSDTRAKEISSSLVDVRRETEERSLNEITSLRNELELTIAKRVELENAFHVQTRTIADLTGENLELNEEMKNMRAAVDNQEALNDKLTSSSKDVAELQKRLTDAGDKLKAAYDTIEELRREERVSQNKILEESKLHNKNTADSYQKIEDMKREMRQLEEREKKLRDDALKKEGALGAMSHDRLKAVHDLVVREEELEKLKVLYEKQKQQEAKLELEWTRKQTAMKQGYEEKIAQMRHGLEDKMTSYIDHNRKAKATIERLNDLLGQRSRENSNLQAKCTSLEHRCKSLSDDVSAVREVSEVARADLSQSKANFTSVKDELHKSKLHISSLEESNAQTKHENMKLKSKMGSIDAFQLQVSQVVSKQQETLSKLLQENKNLRQKLRRIDDAMMDADHSLKDIKKLIDQGRKKSSKHVEKLLQQEEQMATQDIEIEDLRQKVARADVEHKTMRKLRNEINDWRSKFVEMEKAAESAAGLCKDMKRDSGLLQAKYHNEVELRKGVEVEYERLKELVKPQTETMEQMAVELKRALDREQSVRNELRSVHARFASIAMVQQQG
eukprot:g6704.t1